MNPEFNKRRPGAAKPRTDRIIDLGEAGSFKALRDSPGDPPEETFLGESLFSSIHRISSPTGSRVFTAYRSELEPEILLVVWANYPYNQQIEQGGDFMLQVMHDDPSVRILLNDNSYVKSEWMNERMIDYLANRWLPGLIWLGLEVFCHIGSSSLMGGKSFDEFSRWVTETAATIAPRLERIPFRYFPVTAQGLAASGSMDEADRSAALSKVYARLKSGVLQEERGP